MEIKEKMWNLNSSLVNSIVASRKYNMVPKQKEDQIGLIKEFYPTGVIRSRDSNGVIKGRDLEELPDGQLSKISERLLNGSSSRIDNIGGPQEIADSPVYPYLEDFRDSLYDIVRLRKSKKSGRLELESVPKVSKKLERLRSNAWYLDKNITAVLEDLDLPEDSPVIWEYNGWRGFAEGLKVLKPRPEPDNVDLQKIEEELIQEPEGPSQKGLF